MEMIRLGYCTRFSRCSASCRRHEVRSIFPDQEPTASHVRRWTRQHILSTSCARSRAIIAIQHQSGKCSIPLCDWRSGATVANSVSDQLGRRSQFQSIFHCRMAQCHRVQRGHPCDTDHLCQPNWTEPRKLHRFDSDRPTDQYPGEPQCPCASSTSHGHLPRERASRLSYYRRHNRRVGLSARDHGPVEWGRALDHVRK